MKIKNYIILIMFLSIFVSVKAIAKVDNCIECHKQLDEKRLKDPAINFANDIHKRSNLSCTACHNGNSSTEDFGEAKDESTGFIGKPTPAQIPEFCGKCHSKSEYMKKYNPSLPVDQVEKYYTSQHGALLKKGDEKVATCASCHLPHRILPASDPRSSVFKKNVPSTCQKCHSDKKLISQYKIPSDQFDSYIKSVHGKALLEKNDLSAPSCNTCHGNHGAIPPAVGSIEYVCGMCHENNLKLFLDSPMNKGFKNKKYHACAECHGKHLITHPTEEMVNGVQGICTKCHKPKDKGDTLGQEMYKLITSVKNGINNVQLDLKKANNLGMDIEEGSAKIEEAYQSFIHMRTQIHSFSINPVKEFYNTASKSISEAEQISKKAIKEYWKRRYGLILATIFTTILIILLIIKLKSLEKE